MPELHKRIKQGWTLMNAYSDENHHVHYYLERGKLSCEIEIFPNGHGILHTANDDRRI